MRGLDFHPVPRTTGGVGRRCALRDDAFEAEPLRLLQQCDSVVERAGTDDKRRSVHDDLREQRLPVASANRETSRPSIRSTSNATKVGTAPAARSRQKSGRPSLRSVTTSPSSSTSRSSCFASASSAGSQGRMSVPRRERRLSSPARTLARARKPSHFSSYVQPSPTGTTAEALSSMGFTANRGSPWYELIRAVRPAVSPFALGGRRSASG